MILKPGPGWTNEGPAVWDHESGIRIHTGGLCRMPDGSIVKGTEYPETVKLDRAIRRQGGNVRRGVMVWALELQQKVSP